MRGKYKGKSGKINEVKTKRLKIYIDGIQIKKLDGSKTNVPIRASNLQILELNLEDKKRLKNLKKGGISEKKETETKLQKDSPKKEQKEVNKK